MQPIRRIVAGLALVGSLFVLPAAQITQAAPATLDQPVTAGRISQAQENQHYSALLSSMTSLVATPHAQQLRGLRRHGGVRGRVGGPGQGRRGYGLLARGPLLTTLATACHTTSSALQAAIRTGGKTILAICQSTNSSITETDLVTTIINAYKTRLDARVKAGRISANQESQILTRLRTRTETLITTPLPTGSTSSAT